MSHGKAEGRKQKAEGRKQKADVMMGHVLGHVSVGFVGSVSSSDF
jgi:hypothetical protein